MILETLLARALVLAVLGWFLYVAASIAVQAMVATTSLDPEDDDEPVDATDTGAEWDWARDRQLDADLWPVIA